MDKYAQSNHCKTTGLRRQFSRSTSHIPDSERRYRSQDRHYKRHRSHDRNSSAPGDRQPRHYMKTKTKENKRFTSWPPNKRKRKLLSDSSGGQYVPHAMAGTKHTRTTSGQNTRYRHYSHSADRRNHSSHHREESHSPHYRGDHKHRSRSPQKQYKRSPYSSRERSTYDSYLPKFNYKQMQLSSQTTKSSRIRSKPERAKNKQNRPLRRGRKHDDGKRGVPSRRASLRSTRLWLLLNLLLIMCVAAGVSVGLAHFIASKGSSSTTMTEVSSSMRMVSEEYTTDLQDHSSTAFKEEEKKACSATRSLMSKSNYDSADQASCSSKRFSEGSVVADMTLTYPGDVSAEELNQDINQALQTGGAQITLNDNTTVVVASFSVADPQEQQDTSNLWRVSGNVNVAGLEYRPIIDVAPTELIVDTLRQQEIIVLGVVSSGPFVTTGTRLQNPFVIEVELSQEPTGENGVCRLVDMILTSMLPYNGPIYFPGASESDVDVESLSCENIQQSNFVRREEDLLCVEMESLGYAVQCNAVDYSSTGTTATTVSTAAPVTTTAGATTAGATTAPPTTTIPPPKTTTASPTNTNPPPTTTNPPPTTVPPSTATISTAAPTTAAPTTVTPTTAAPTTAALTTAAHTTVTSTTATPTTAAATTAAPTTAAPTTAAPTNAAPTTAAPTTAAPTNAALTTAAPTTAAPTTAGPTTAATITATPTTAAPTTVAPTTATPTTVAPTTAALTTAAPTTAAHTTAEPTTAAPITAAPTTAAPTTVTPTTAAPTTAAATTAAPATASPTTAVPTSAAPTTAAPTTAAPTTVTPTTAAPTTAAPTTAAPTTVTPTTAAPTTAAATTAAPTTASPTTAVPTSAAPTTAAPTTAAPTTVTPTTAAPTTAAPTTAAPTTFTAGATIGGTTAAPHCLAPEPRSLALVQPNIGPYPLNSEVNYTCQALGDLTPRDSITCVPSGQGSTGGKWQPTNCYRGCVYTQLNSYGVGDRDIAAACGAGMEMHGCSCNNPGLCWALRYNETDCWGKKLTTWPISLNYDCHEKCPDDQYSRKVYVAQNASYVPTVRCNNTHRHMSFCHGSVTHPANMTTNDADTQLTTLFGAGQSFTATRIVDGIGPVCTASRKCDGDLLGWTCRLDYTCVKLS